MLSTFSTNCALNFDQAGRQASRQAGRQAGRQTDKLAGRQAGRQAGGQVGRQSGRWLIDWQAAYQASFCTFGTSTTRCVSNMFSGTRWVLPNHWLRKSCQWTSEQVVLARFSGSVSWLFLVSESELVGKVFG